jgi:hypothetical protein
MGEAPIHDDPFLTELAAIIEGASSDAILELKQAGLPLFLFEDGIDIVEQPDGRRFQIKYLQETRGYTIVRELEPYI